MDDERTRGEWSGHVLVLHRSPEERAALVGEWLRGGLLGAERVIYPHGPLPLEVLHSSSTGTGRGPEPDVGRALEDGRLLVLTPGDYYAAGRARTLVRQAFADGFPGVRMLGDAQVALEHVGEAGYVDFELELERLCSRRAVSATCLYDEDATPRRLLLDNLTVHADGLRADVLSVTDRDRTVRLAGEADATNAELLTAVLDGASRRVPGDAVLTLDLQDLRFCDAAGVRALVVGTWPLRRRGGRVALVDVSGSVRRALSILSIGSQPGFLLDGGQPR